VGTDGTFSGPHLLAPQPLPVITRVRPVCPRFQLHILPPASRAFYCVTLLRMKIALVAVFLLGCTTTFAQSAHDYYDELYKAGGLDRMADQYVCFSDDADNKNFFIFGQSDAIKDLFKDGGEFAKLPRAEQNALNKGFLVVRGYTRGVPFPDRNFYEKTGSPGLFLTW